MQDETLDTVGLAPMIDKVAALARATEAGAKFLPIPAGVVSPGAIIEKPHLLVVTNGEGAVKIEPIAPLLAELRGKPIRRKGTATAKTLDSFVDLVNRNGDLGTVIFLDADWRAPKVQAVLNYHIAVGNAEEASADMDPGDDEAARFCDHRVKYDFPLSEAWKTWVDTNGKFMTSEDFARWLEDHIAEIAVPDTEPGSTDRLWEERFRTRIAQPNELVDLARDLAIIVNARIKQKTRLESGETAMVFETEHQDLQGQPVTIPGLFVLHLPVFFRGIPQRILVRLRYRPAGGDGVLWAYELHRPDEAVDERVRADAEEIAHRTGRLVIDGAPEA